MAVDSKVADDKSGQVIVSRKGRLGSKKTRTGCITCKIRRIKCDETHPNCSRCTSTGRRCDGYAAVTSSGSSSSGSSRSISPGSLSVSRAFSSSPSATSRERRAFDFYCRKVAPSLSGLSDVKFWCQLIPQLGQAEPVVWDAIIAIGSLMESSGSAEATENINTGETFDANHQLGMKWYSRAISRVHQIIEERADFVLALLTSILFVCVETIQDDIPRTLNLVHHSVKLLKNIYDSKAIDGSESLVNAAYPIVRWLCHACASFGKSEPLNVCALQLETKRRMHMPKSMPWTFDSLQEARDALHALTPEIVTNAYASDGFKRDVKSPFRLLASVISHNNVTQCRLQEWLKTFNNSLRLKSMGYLEQERKSVALLYRDHAVVSIVSHRSVITQETALDAFFPLFESIVRNLRIVLDADSGSHSDCESSKPDDLNFRFDSHVIPSLCFVTSQCRHPIIRRQAFDLLHLAPRKESFWKASVAQRIEGRIIAYEEGTVDNDGVTLLPVENVAIPDESRRVHRWEISKIGWEMSKEFALRQDKEPVMMTMTRYVVRPDGTKQMVQDQVLV